MKRKSSLTALLCSSFVILCYTAFLPATTISEWKQKSSGERSPLQSLRKFPNQKGSGLEAFYEELKQFGYRKGGGGSVLFRKTIIAPKLSSVPVFLRVYVASSPAHTDRRNAIRETWASQGSLYNVSVVFVIGKSKLDEEIRRESIVHGMACE